MLVVAGGGSAGPECRFAYLSPIRLTSISLSTFALTLPNCCCSAWLPSLNMVRSCPTLEWSITRGAKELQVWQPLGSSAGWNRILLLENSRSETESEWYSLNRASAACYCIVRLHVQCHRGQYWKGRREWTIFILCLIPLNSVRL